MSNTMKKFTRLMKKRFSADAGTLVIALAVLASTFLILSFQNAAAVYCQHPDDPGSCVPWPCQYSGGPDPDTECRFFCGDDHIQTSKGEECDLGLNPNGTTASNEICSNKCRSIIPPNAQHKVCQNNACTLVQGQGTPECAVDDDCGNDPNPYTDIVITASADNVQVSPPARWQLFCPTGIPSYSCNSISGSLSAGQASWICPGFGEGTCNQETVAGKGNYTVNGKDYPNANNPQWIFSGVTGDSSPFYRSPKPPRFVTILWNLEYVPATTDPTQPAIDIVGGASCVSGPYPVTVFWSGTPAAYGFKVDISDDSTFGRYWQKTVASGLSTDAPAGFAPMGTASGALTLTPTTTYYARVTGALGVSATRTFSAPLCTYQACDFVNRTCATFPGTSSSTCLNNGQCQTPSPSCTFGAAPDRIVIPPTATSNLAWSCQNVSSCSLDHGIGSVPASGNSAVTPSETTTYTLNCAGASSTPGYTGSATVRVFSFVGGSLKEIRPQ